MRFDRDEPHSFAKTANEWGTRQRDNSELRLWMLQEVDAQWVSRTGIPSWSIRRFLTRDYAAGFCFLPCVFRVLTAFARWIGPDF
jgi:hypothetical protein